MPENGMWVIGYGSLIFKPPPRFSFKISGYLKGFIRRFWQSSSDHRGTPESPGRVVTLISLEDLKKDPRFLDDLHMYELGNRPESDVVTTSVPTDTSKIRSTSHQISHLNEDDLKVWGVAYYIAPEDVDFIKNYLDIREQDGYTMHEVPFHITNTPDIPECVSILKKIPRENGDFFIKSSIYIGTTDNVSFVGPESIHKTGDIIKTSIGPSGPNSEYLRNLTLAVRLLNPDGNSRDYYLEDLLSIVEKK